MRRLFVVTHRWLSLVLGLLLLAITVSGAVLVYEPEIGHTLNSGAYDASGGTPTTTFAEALAAVQQAHPSFAAADVVSTNGVLVVTDYTTGYTVDPASGEVLGKVSPPPTWLGWLENLHMCLLTCPEYPGHLSWLEKPVSHTAWLSLEDGTDVTIGSLALGAFGILLVYLSLTGLWLWFPRPKKLPKWLQSGFTVRRGKGRFARDTDLHKVIGIAALLPLLVWGITGAGFELKPVADAWYAASPGTQHEVDDPAPSKVKGPPIGMDRAEVLAQAAVPGATVETVSVVAKGDHESPYYVWLSSAHDPYAKTDYPGNIGVAVDQRTGEATVTYGGAGDSTAQVLWDQWNYPVHSGFVVNGWWRLLWLLLGLTPVALAVTGVSTWLVRRRSAARRRAASPGPGRRLRPRWRG